MTALAPCGAPQTDPRDVYLAKSDTSEEAERAQIQAARRDIRDRTGARLSFVRARSLYRYWQAQARAEAGFVDWIITYADPTGEHATNVVLSERARALAA